jgi:hypothetical protein
MRIILLLSLGLAANTVAAGQSSSNYNVRINILDGGGGRTSSASYSNDGSVGGFGGLATASAPQETARAGYIAQLLEPVSLAVTIPSTNINEASFQQLSGILVMDDGSATAYLDWSILSGPIAFLSPSGLLTAANVYQDTPATISGAGEGLSKSIGLLIKNTGNDDLGLYAGDGIPDPWQAQYFGANNPAGTGPKALFAYTAGLNPTNPADVFTLNLSPVPAHSQWRNVTFSPRYTDRTYTVQYSDSLNNGSFTALTNAVISDASTTRTVVDTNAVSSSRFYRVGISYP